MFICCWNSQETWHYMCWTGLSVHQQIASNAESFLELGNTCSPGWSYTAGFSIRGAQARDGLAFFPCRNLLPQLCVFLPCQEEGLPALGHHLFYCLGKGKSEGNSELPIRIPESQGRASAPPLQTDPPSEICMKGAESLRSPPHG